MRVFTGSWYWKNCGNANQVWIEPVSDAAATSYFLVSTFRLNGAAGRPIVSVRSMVSSPRSSASQSLNTSRTIRVFAAGSAM